MSNQNVTIMPWKDVDRSTIDPEFLPFLDELNAVAGVKTIQSCIGHIPYIQGNHNTCSTRSSNYKPSPGETHWGYLQLILPGDMAMALCEWLYEEADWLLVSLSQIFPYYCCQTEPNERPYVIDNGDEPDSIQLTLVWDSQQWPRPAAEILGFITSYDDGTLITLLDEE